MIIAITIYIVSAISMWRYVNLAFSKNGRWENLKTGLMEIAIVFTPIFNTISNLLWLIAPPHKREFDFSNFFKIKK